MKIKESGLIHNNKFTKKAEVYNEIKRNYYKNINCLHKQCINYTVIQKYKKEKAIIDNLDITKHQKIAEYKNNIIVVEPHFLEMKNGKITKKEYKCSQDLQQ